MYNTYQPSLTISNDENNSILFTVPELADYLGIGRNRAYDLLRNNIIKGFRIGNTWKVSKITVDQYILQNSDLSIQSSINPVFSRHIAY